MTCDDGEEILMHVGLDTVKLAGEHFEPLVRPGQKVKRGDLLMRFDIAKIKAAGYDTVTPIILLNHDQFVVNKATGGLVKVGDTIITLAK